MYQWWSLGMWLRIWPLFWLKPIFGVWWSIEMTYQVHSCSLLCKSNQIKSPAQKLKAKARTPLCVCFSAHLHTQTSPPLWGWNNRFTKRQILHCTVLLVDSRFQQENLVVYGGLHGVRSVEGFDGPSPFLPSVLNLALLPGPSNYVSLGT